MNHARGALRTVIHRGIWEEMRSLLRNGSYMCTCGGWASTAGHYFAALVQTDAYPLEKMLLKEQRHQHSQHAQVLHDALPGLLSTLQYRLGRGGR